MKTLVLAVILIITNSAVFAQQHTEQLLNSYLTVKNALIASDSKTASSAIATFHGILQSEQNFEQKSVLLESVEKFKKSGSNLEKQRASFNALSTIMWTVVKNAPKNSTSLYYQYCPMKKAYWVSKEKDIKNPYYGSSMLSCGKVVETKN
ncbi:DUF3347 domain-containing protein [Sphingobacterium sp. LRF_L2]|uniref:DUF3347 domain-containing protein n=1 Tax=Sphingobacterium sp. LRF_L2 TaxID=3369421 RepID=UPI003F5F3DC7